MRSGKWLARALGSYPPFELGIGTKCTESVAEDSCAHLELAYDEINAVSQNCADQSSSLRALVRSAMFGPILLVPHHRFSRSHADFPGTACHSFSR